MGPALKFYAVDKGVAGGGPGDPATYLYVVHLHCDSIEDFQRGFGPHTQEIMLRSQPSGGTHPVW